MPTRCIVHTLRDTHHTQTVGINSNLSYKMIPDTITIEKEAELLKRRLDDSYFNSKLIGDSFFVIKEKRQPFGYNEYAFFLISLSGLFYFTLIDFQSFIASLFFILFLFAIAVFIIYPRRVKNQYFKIDFKSQIIYFRNGLSNKDKNHYYQS